MRFKKVPISDFGEIITGNTPSSSCPEHFGSDILFVTPSDNFDMKYICNTIRKLSSEGGKQLYSKMLPPKSVMVTCIGSDMGKIAMNVLPAITNQQINSIIIDKSNYNASYVYYKLKSSYRALRQYATGSTSVPILNKTDFCNIEISVVDDIKIQKRISEVLSTLDTKIQLNNRTKIELEEMAKTIYDYWFVQFDFPDKNDRPYKTSGGKMVWNKELRREIPVGWKVVKINDEISVKDGTHDSPKAVDKGYHLITSKHLMEWGIDFQSANLISEVDYISVNKRSKVDTGDILFSMIGTVGTIYKVEEKDINFAIKNVALYKTSEKNEYKNYIYMYLKSLYMRMYIANVLSGSIQKFISLGDLRNMPLLISNEHIINYHKMINHLFNKMDIIKEENQELIQLRNWLLPMLMNGQVGFK